MRTAVVTGANGFIGKALVGALLKKGVHVIAIVHCMNRNVQCLNDAIVIKCDLDSYHTLHDSLLHYKPDVFYHLAWEGSSGEKRANDRIQLCNVQGACDAVRLAYSIGCEKFVFSSSIMEYEVDLGIKNGFSPTINSIYSTAKIAADYMCRIIATSLNMHYIAALISNVYGPGECSPRLINSSIRKLLAGEHLSLSPCEQLYDFVYIDDAARMFVAIGENGSSGSTYYIGNRKVYPLKKFMVDLRDVVAPGVELGFGELPINNVGLSYNEFDKELLYKDTGIQPEVSFVDGIRTTSDWIKEEGNLG